MYGRSPQLPVDTYLGRTTYEGFSSYTPILYVNYIRYWVKVMPLCVGTCTKHIHSRSNDVGILGTLKTFSVEIGCGCMSLQLNKGEVGS